MLRYPISLPVIQYRTCHSSNVSVFVDERHCHKLRYRELDTAWQKCGWCISLKIYTVVITFNLMLYQRYPYSFQNTTCTNYYQNKYNDNQSRMQLSLLIPNNLNIHCIPLLYILLWKCHRHLCLVLYIVVRGHYYPVLVMSQRRG